MSVLPFTVRHNPMQLNSISAFMNIRGNFRQQTKDVYFLRLIGCSNPEQFLRELHQMDCYLQETPGGYLRILRFPELPPTEQLAPYLQCWDQPQTLQFHSTHALLEQTIQQQLAALPQLYQQYAPQSSPSMLRNFMVKVLFWSDQFFPALFQQWDIHHSAKFVCSGLLKKQEYLFCYFLTLLGVDVLYFNPLQDLTLDDPLLQLSQCSRQKQFHSVSIPAFTEISPSAKKECTVSALPSAPKQAQTQQPTPSTKQEPAKKIKQEKSFEELATLAASVVMIEALDTEGNCMKTGSGIIVHPQGYILTNFHVVCSSHQYRIKLEGEESSYACYHLIKYHSLYDLALLRIDRVCTALPIYQEKAPLIRGQKVVAIGSPLGLFNSVSDGIISGFRLVNDTNMIQFTAPTSPGSSGGALLNMQGQVIGICTAGIQEGQNLNLAVDAQTILLFLRGFLPQ